MFLGTKNKVYILDKSENNPTTIDGKYGTHPAWAVEYDIKTQQGELHSSFALCAASSDSRAPATTGK